MKAKLPVEDIEKEIMVLRQSGCRRVYSFEMEVGVLEVNEIFFFRFIVEFGFWLCSYADLFVFFLVPWRLWRTATPLKNQKDLERRGSQRPSKFNADDFYSFFIFTYCKSSEKSIWNQRTVCTKNTPRVSNTFNVWRCTGLSPTKNRPADYPNLAAAQQKSASAKKQNSVFSL